VEFRFPEAAPWSNSTMKRARRTPPSHAHKTVARLRYCLADLLLQMPEGAPIDEVGREVEPAAVTRRTIRAMQRFMRKQLRNRVGSGINLRQLIDEGRD
jgi:hypothetical protein